MARENETEKEVGWENVPEIPREEQPYPLPDGWKWVFLSSIAKWSSGGTPSRKHPEYFLGEFFWVKSGELYDGNIYSTEEQITQEAINHSSAKLFPPETVAMAMYGATIGKLGIFKIEAATNQACACAICHNFIHNKYLFFYLLSQRDEFIKKGKGGAQPNISQEVIKFSSIPLPPLSAQYQIVSRIESLFSKLDKAAEKLRAVIDSHEARKQAILHKAFSGELTQDMEAEQDDNYKNIPEIPEDEQPYGLPEGWKWVNGKYIFESGDNITPFGDFFEYIDIDSIDNSRQIIKISKRVAVKDAPTRARKKLSFGYTLFSMVRPYLRNIAYIDENYSDCIASTGFYVCKPKNINNKCLFWLMTSDYVVNGLNQYMRGDNSPSIKKEDIENFIFPHPPLSTQKQIVEIIESLFANMEKTFEAARESLAKIEMIKKSILSKAFRGELV